MKLSMEHTQELNWRETEHPDAQAIRVAWIGPEHDLFETIDRELFPVPADIAEEVAPREEGILLVEFRQGGVWACEDVPESEVDELVGVQSTVRYLMMKPGRRAEQVVVG